MRLVSIRSRCVPAGTWASIHAPCSTSHQTYVLRPDHGWSALVRRLLG